jgi:hypothetical protein
MKIFVITFLFIIILLIIILDNTFKKKSKEKFNVRNTIPKIIFQTYINKDNIPYKVFDNINKYAEGYTHIIYDDNECIQFLKDHYPPIVIKTYLRIKKGAHRADLFRYCLLNKYGGIYLDIKTELIKPLNEIFTNNYLYSVLSIEENTIYQGIIATPPNNPIFKVLINRIINTTNSDLSKRYGLLTAQFYEICRESCNNQTLINGLNFNTRSNINIYLFREKCSKISYDCYDGLDRYGRCCNVYDKGIKVIKTRYSDYPW